MTDYVNIPQHIFLKYLRASGILLTFSAITFWLSWFLMPEQGTNSTERILHIVKETRASVYCSVIVQVVSSVVYIPALFFLCRALLQCNYITLSGCILLSIGAMGMCMDAFFHLLAYYMTDQTIHLQPAIVTLMTSVQTKGILFLAPLLAVFFAGTLLITIGLKKQKIISGFPLLVTILALVTAIAGAVVVHNILGYGRPQLVLTVLGLFAFAQLLTGKEMITRTQEQNR